MKFRLLCLWETIADKLLPFWCEALPLVDLSAVKSSRAYIVVHVRHFTIARFAFPALVP